MVGQKGWKPDQFRVAGKMSTDIAAEEDKAAARAAGARRRGRARRKPPRRRAPEKPSVSGGGGGGGGGGDKRKRRRRGGRGRGTVRAPRTELRAAALDQLVHTRSAPSRLAARRCARSRVPSVARALLDPDPCRACRCSCRS